MGVKHSEIEFRISRRTMWVGDQAYPLQGITRVRPIDVKPRRGRMVGRYARKAGAWVGLGVLGLLVIGCAGDSLPPVVPAAFALLVLGALAYHTVQLLRGLTLPPLYILSVATSGTAQAALVSTNREQIHELTHRVVDAIDNPTMEYAIRVDHIEIHGDNVHGHKFDGDYVNGGKTLVDGWG
ncbi:hypothetical protein F4553_008119 [Allocatelliglobosispora scoriae]|uniref:Uncharacterized protein n=1 Tax=Allocatelliglobosispora scoriae TaxID=643052 RepID=A0A841BZS0_9ACTN|nr:DUF6232 family protein [Allocatelliglobosispora scoriae]MBB5874667.1 hypothetical protein [Allocatelliglobosispora scoriae]